MPHRTQEGGGAEDGATYASYFADLNLMDVTVGACCACCTCCACCPVACPPSWLSALRGDTGGSGIPLKFCLARNVLLHRACQPPSCLQEGGGTEPSLGSAAAPFPTRCCPLPPLLPMQHAKQLLEDPYLLTKFKREIQERWALHEAAAHCAGPLLWCMWACTTHPGARCLTHQAHHSTD